jgi:hypothetical protein
MTPGNYDSSDVALGDFDNDGDLDIASYGENETLVYENENGEFDTTATWASAESMWISGELVWADIDNDQYPELITSRGIYMNDNGILSVDPIWTDLSMAWSFTVGDVNADGYVDIVLGGVGWISVYENVAGVIDETSDWNTTEDNSASALALGDVDNDGYDELAVGNWWNDPARIYDNVGGSLNNVSMWNSTETDRMNELVWGDIDSDGYPELFACTDNILGDVPNRIYMNSGGMLERAPSWNSTIPFSGEDAKVFDIDDDDDLDLLVAISPMGWAQPHNGAELVYLNEDGLIDQIPDWSGAYEDISEGLDVGDVNGDGFPDLVVANYEDALYDTFGGNPGRLLIYNNLGPNQLPQITSVAANPSEPETGKESTISVQATDLDGDELDYVFSVQPGNGTIVSMSSNTAVWRAPDKDGTYIINITVSDGRDDITRDFQITVVEPFISSENIWFLLILVVIIVSVVVVIAVVVVRKRRKPPEVEASQIPEEEIPPPPP